MNDASGIGRADNQYIDRYFSAPDGLMLHGRDYGPREATAVPVVCLPGLTRNAADFHALAAVLAADANHPRRVLALDYRGRGLSERDRDWKNYDVKVELADTLAFLAAAGVQHAVFLGTSRGGLVTMGVAAARPAMIRGVILNDIGPVVDARGLIRIRNYVGKLPQPASWDEAIAAVKRFSADHFPAVEDAEWRAFAQATWQEENGALSLSYDPFLMKGLATLDLEAPLPTLWPFFEGLTPFPTLAIRGGNSDLLSEATLAEMSKRHPLLQTYTVVGHGHAPLLMDRTSIDRVKHFVEDVESAEAPRAAIRSASA